MFKSCSAFSFVEFMRKLVSCERGRDSERPFTKFQPRPRDDIITAGWCPQHRFWSVMITPTWWSISKSIVHESLHVKTKTETLPRCETRCLKNLSTLRDVPWSRLDWDGAFRMNILMEKSFHTKLIGLFVPIFSDGRLNKLFYKSCVLILES